MPQFKKSRKVIIGGYVTVWVLLSSFISSADAENRYLTQKSLDSLECTNGACFFPAVSLADCNIVVSDKVVWNRNKSLVLHTRKNILFEDKAQLVVENDQSLALKVGMEPGSRVSGEFGRIIFQNSKPQVFIKGKGGVKIYYHPTVGQEQHKYLNPQDGFYEQHLSLVEKINLTLYMLVNDVYDLQNIGLFLSGNYALSQNIDASETKSWNHGLGFDPLKDSRKNMPFSGDFDGNGYAIERLYIHRPRENKVGLFGVCSGFANRPNLIENLTLRGFEVTGDHYVGALAGWATNTELSDVRVINFSVKSRDIAGGLVGAMYKVKFYLSIFLNQQEKLEASKYKGYITGSSNDCSGVFFFRMIKAKDFDQETPHHRVNRVAALLNEDYPYIGSQNNTELTGFIGFGENGNNLSHLRSDLSE